MNLQGKFPFVVSLSALPRVKTAEVRCPLVPAPHRRSSRRRCESGFWLGPREDFLDELAGGQRPEWCAREA